MQVPKREHASRSTLAALLLGATLTPLAVAPAAAQTTTPPPSGFVPQPRPGTNPATDGGGATDYDWTGLLASVDGADESFSQTPLYFGPNYYYGNQQNLSVGYDPDTGAYNGFGASIEINGSSTYKWLWSPPVNPIGLQNDPAKAATDMTQPFPEYPTFMLESTLPFVSADVEPQYSSTADTEVGEVLDSFDSTWNPTFN